jgi:ubiquinone/menaquinone biosynthesis C-methylase UbiE
MKQPDEIERIRSVYETQYNSSPDDWGYLWHPRNPVSIAYRHALEVNLVALLNQAGLKLDELEILDIGCGTGNLLRFCLSLGADAQKLHGIDLIQSRIEAGLLKSPQGIDFRSGDAQNLPYPDQSMDLVCFFTVFSSILEPETRQNVARQASRVLRSGGRMLWYDMRRARTTTTRGLELDEIQELFPELRLRHLRKIHPAWGTRIARRSRLAFNLLEWIPLTPRSHYLGLWQKI